MPDYLDYNPSKEAVDKDRKGKAERQKRWREAHGRRVTNGVTDASEDGAPSRPAPKEAGRDKSRPGERPSGRANPSGSPVRALRPPWCGECDETTRQTGDPPRRCPSCHPLVVEAEAQ